METKKFRIIYALSFTIILIIEIFIALFVHDDIIRPYVGDIIVSSAVYMLVRIFIPEKFRLMPLYVFLFAVFVEFMQYINIIAILGLENNSFFRTLIGTSFSWIDIICYFIGCIPLVFWEFKLKAYNLTKYS